MNECVWTICIIILRVKNQNTQRKIWPSATLSTTYPIQTGLQVNHGISGERYRTSSYSRLPTVGEVPKNAFHYIDQSQCVVLHVVCVTNTGCVLSEVDHVYQISHIQYLDYFP